jgi:hypothetical protein
MMGKIEKIGTLNLGEDDSYFRPLAEFLMAKMKYQEGKTLFAAQYDWRHHQKSGWNLDSTFCQFNSIQKL